MLPIGSIVYVTPFGVNQVLRPIGGYHTIAIAFPLAPAIRVVRVYSGYGSRPLACPFGSSLLPKFPPEDLDNEATRPVADDLPDASTHIAPEDLKRGLLELLRNPDGSARRVLSLGRPT
jgi:hypothetical protein